MPGAVAYDRFPDTATTVVVVAIDKALIVCWSAVLRRRKNIDWFACLRAVKVPYVDLAVMRARVDVSSVCGARWREMAADKCLEYAMTTEGDK